MDGENEDKIWVRNKFERSTIKKKTEKKAKQKEVKKETFFVVVTDNFGDEHLCSLFILLFAAV